MIRKCINGCLVHKGIHYNTASKETPQWTEEQIEILSNLDDIITERSSG